MGAGILTNFHHIQNDLLGIVLTLVATTVATFTVTGLVVEFLSRAKEKSKGETAHE